MANQALPIHCCLDTVLLSNVRSWQEQSRHLSCPLTIVSRSILIRDSLLSGDHLCRLAPNDHLRAKSSRATRRIASESSQRQCRSDPLVGDRVCLITAALPLVVCRLICGLLCLVVNYRSFSLFLLHFTQQVLLCAQCTGSLSFSLPSPPSRLFFWSSDCHIVMQGIFI